MAVLLGPARRKRWVPPVHATLNPSHPLARSIVDIVIAGPANLGIGRTPTYSGGTPTRRGTEWGDGFYCTTSGSSYLVGPPSENQAYTMSGGTLRPVTMRLVYVPVTLPGPYTALIDKGANSGDRDTSVFADTAGDISFTHFAGDGQNSTVVTAGMTAGRLWDLVTVFNGTEAQHYVNAVPQGSPLTIGNGITPASSDWLIGNNTTGGGNSPDMVVVTAMSWVGRALDPDDIAELYDDPWSMLVATTLRSYTFLGAPAAVETTWLNPTSDVATNSWTTDSGATTNLYQAIDEDVASDTDYIRSAVGASSASYYETALETSGDAGLSTDHTVSYRYQKSGTTVADLTVSLRQGTSTEIASWAHTGITTSWATANQTLSGGQADSITDYTDLRIRFAPTATAGLTPTLVADRGSTQNITGAASDAVDLAAGASITVGNYLIARVAVDNSGASGAKPGLTVSDTRSNTWTVLDPANSNADPGAASAGASVYVAYAKVANAYSNGDDLTFTWGTGNPVAKAIVVEEWSGIHATSPVAVTAVGANGTATPADISITPNTSGQLVYTCLATEGPTGDTAPNDTSPTNGSWTSLTRLSTGSGTATSNQTVAGQYNTTAISGVSNQWNPTITSRDWAAIAVVFAPAASDARAQVSWAGLTAPTGTVEVQGTATATLALTATATGTKEVLGIATGALTVAATGTGTRTASDGTATAALAVTATATGVVTHPGTAAANPTLTATATGLVTHPGTAAAALVVTADATGTRTHFGTATGALTLTANGNGTRTASDGTASAALAVTATATGTVEVPAVASAALLVTADATGTKIVNGTATSSPTLTATATGTKTVNGTVTGALTVAATGNGTRETFATAAAVLAVTADATGTRTHFGTATSALTVTADATGSSAPPGEGVAAAALTLTATATGTKTVNGTATAALVVTADATGVRTTTGTAASPLTLAADATGVPEVLGVAAAALTATGTATGTVTPVSGGTATAALTLAATAVGTVTVNGTAASDTVLTATAVGVRTILGVAAASLDLTAIANGARVLTGTARADLVLLAAAVQTIHHIAHNLLVVPAQTRVAAVDARSRVATLESRDRIATPEL